MNNLKKWGKRSLTLLVVLSMCLSTLSLTALADDGQFDVDGVIDQLESAVGNVTEKADSFAEDLEQNASGEDAANVVGSEVGDVNGAIDEALKGIDEAVGKKAGEVDEALQKDLDDLDEVNNGDAVKKGLEAEEAFREKFGDEEKGTSGSLGETKGQVDAAEGTITGNNAEVEKKVEEADKKVEEAEAEASGTYAEVDDVLGNAKDMADAALEQVTEFADDVRAAASNGRLTDAEIQGLKDRVDGLDDIVGQAETAVNDAEDRLERAQKRVEDLLAQINQVKDAVDGANSFADEKWAEVEGDGGLKAQLQDALTQAEKDLSDAYAALVAAQNAQKTAQDCWTRANEVLKQLKDLSEAPAAGDRSVEDLKDKLEALKDLIQAEANAALADAEAKAKYKDLPQGLSEAEESALQGQIDDLQDALEAKDAYDKAQAASENAENLEGLIEGDIGNAMAQDKAYTEAETAFKKADAVKSAMEDALNDALKDFDFTGLNSVDVDALLNTLAQKSIIAHDSTDGDNNSINIGQVRDALTRVGIKPGNVAKDIENPVEYVDDLVKSICAALEKYYYDNGTNKKLGTVISDSQKTMTQNQDGHDKMEQIQSALGDEYDESMTADEIVKKAQEIKEAAAKNLDDAEKLWNEYKDSFGTAYKDDLDEATLAALLSGMPDEQIAELMSSLKGDKSTKKEQGVSEREAYNAAKALYDAGGTAGNYENAQNEREAAVSALKDYFQTTEDIAGNILDLVLAQLELKNRDEENGSGLSEMISEKVNKFEDAQKTVNKALEDYEKAKQRVEEAQAALANLSNATDKRAGQQEYEGFEDYEAYLMDQLKQAQEQLAEEEEQLNLAIEAKNQAVSDLAAAKAAVDALLPYIPPADTNSGYDGSGEPADGPEANVPEENVPEANIPEENAPEANVPEENAPEANVPGVNAPETNVPGVNAPEANVPGVNAPEANVPEANAPVANVPGADDAVVDIPDADVPLAATPAVNGDASADAEGDALVDIADEDVPLAGFAAENEAESRSAVLWISLIAGFSAVGAAAWVLLRRKTRA